MISLRRVVVGMIAAFGAALVPHAASAQATARQDWTGIYVGGHGGFAWTGADVANVEGIHYFANAGQSDSYSASSWIGGGHLGLNYQIGPWVLGGEAALTRGRFQQSQTHIGAFSPVDTQADISRLFTAAGRLGYAWNGWLPYAKLGYASATLSTNATERPTFDHDAASRARHTGLVAGLGLEHMVASNLIVGLDYSLIALGARTHNGTDFSGITPYVVKVDPDAIHAVTARISFKLGGK